MLRPRPPWTLLAAFAVACDHGGVVTLEPAPTQHYVVSQLLVPMSNEQANSFGLDLDGNGTIDNELGMVFGTLADSGLSVQESNDAAVAEGRMILLIEQQSASERGGFAALGGLQVFLGADPQPPACNPGETYTCTTADPPVCTGCGHQLTGSGVFDIAAGSPQNPALLGDVVDGQLQAGPGALTLELALGGGPPAQVDLIGGRAVADLDGSGALAGTVTLAGGVSQTAMDDEVIPAAQQLFASIIEHDCCGAPTSPGGATCNPSSTGPHPSCGCITPCPQSATELNVGSCILQFFNTAATCTISSADIEMNGLVRSLLAPDVMIDGQWATSFGVQATVVDATF